MNNTALGLNALAEVMTELAIYSDRGIVGELSRFLSNPTQVKLDVLISRLDVYLEHYTLEEFREWCEDVLL